MATSRKGMSVRGMMLSSTAPHGRHAVMACHATQTAFERGLLRIETRIIGNRGVRAKMPRL